jgi:hypothetical protein
MGPSSEVCTWCGAGVEPEDGYRLTERPGDRSAVFCRLEHVVPWALQGAHWTAGGQEDPAAEDLESCAHCGERLTEVRVTLIRHRGEHRIADAFCSVDHAAAWARVGGRWR